MKKFSLTGRIVSRSQTTFFHFSLVWLRETTGKMMVVAGGSVEYLQTTSPTATVSPLTL